MPLSVPARILPVSLLLAIQSPLQAAGDPAEAASAALSNTQIEQALKPAAHEPATRGLRRHDAGHVNLDIPFEYNSSQIKSQAYGQLQQLQLALQSDALHGDRFLVAGHTDARGTADYNQKLSLQRADAVKHYLAAHGIDPARLDTIGYGSQRLLDPDKPDDPRNRRVEIRDLGSAKE
jgi:outer membrane protein OmpA-like peptidoglycan-associated protein